MEAKRGRGRRRGREREGACRIAPHQRPTWRRRRREAESSSSGTRCPLAPVCMQIRRQRVSASVHMRRRQQRAITTFPSPCSFPRFPATHTPKKFPLQRTRGDRALAGRLAVASVDLVHHIHARRVDGAKRSKALAVCRRSTLVGSTKEMMRE